MSARAFPLCPIAAGCAAALLWAAGCQSAPATNSTTAASNPAKSSVGPPMRDVQTEAAILEMENEYTAAKNSQPTNQHQAAAKKEMKIREVRAEEARQLKAQKEQADKEAAEKAEAGK